MYLNNTQFSRVPDFLPPHNIDAEESVLGGLMLDPHAYERVSEILSPEAFYLKPHKEIYRAICKLRQRKEVTDLMTVTSFLSDRGKLDNLGGPSKLAQLIDRTVSAANIDRHAMLLIDKQIRRQIIEHSYTLQKLATVSTEETAPLLEKVESLTHKLTQSKHRYNLSEDYIQSKCQSLIDEVRRIELEVERPDHREFLLQELAIKTRRSINHLKNLYHKSLIADQNEPMMTMAESEAKYGQAMLKWFFHGICPQGQTVLIPAEGGCGKTLFVHDLAYRLLTGQSMGEFHATAQSRRVLYVQTDTPANVALASMAQRGIHDGLPIRCKWKWTTDHVVQLKKEIQHFGAEVIIIDSLTSSSKFSTISENDVDYARPILELNDIAQELGCTFLILHHNNRDGQPRGTTAIANSVSMVMHIDRVPGDNNLKSTQRLFTIGKARSRCPAKYLADLNPETKEWRWSLFEEDGTMPTTMRESITKFLADNPNIRYEAKEIQAVLGGSINTVRTAAYDLAEEGVINKYRQWNNRPWLFFLELADPPTNRSAGDQPANDYPVRGSSSGRSVTSQNGANQNQKNEKCAENEGSAINQTSKPIQEKEFPADRSPKKGGSTRKVKRSARSASINQNNFFESQTASNINAQPAANVGSIVNNNHNQAPTLAKYQVGDRLRYIGKRYQSLRDVPLVVASVEPKSVVDYYYICQPEGRNNWTGELAQSDLIPWENSPERERQDTK